MDKVYLRPDVYFEPLFNRWFLWPHLLAPATAAMNVANRHMRVMKSFVANAKIHARSAQLKALSGSSLMNLPASSATEVQALIEYTQQHHADLLALAAAIAGLDALLRSEARGMALDALYPAIPEPLQGLVELHYDLNNQASFRLIEGLLYHSRYYKPEAQSLRFGTLQSSERAFVLSTPRLPDAHHLDIQVPFAHPFVDRLFSMRDRPRPLVDIVAEARELGVRAGPALENLFTHEAPPPRQRYEGDGVRIRYLGHAGLLIETAQTVLLIDPVIAYRNDAHGDKLSYDDLPARIDIVVLTHTHMDHTCLETLIQLRHKIDTVVVPQNNSGNLADPSIKLMLKAIGFRRVVDLDDMESLPCADGRVVAIPFLGEHADVNVRSKSAWLFELCGQRILAAADSSNIDPMLYQALHRIFGDIDVLFIGMECVGGPLRWLYGPLLTQPLTREHDESRRFRGSDYAAATQIARAVNAAQVYVYAMGSEPWFAYFMGLTYDGNEVQLVEAQKLVDDCRSRGLPSARLGGCETFHLPARVAATSTCLF